MQLKVLGSGSAGNCYILDNGKDALVVECGVKFAEVKKALNFDIARINGCLCSHEHGDHSDYAGDFLRARIEVYASRGTIEEIVSRTRIEDHSMPLLKKISAGQKCRIGAFNVLPFPIQHDAAEPMGFLIQHPEMGVCLFATDTYYLKYKFEGLNQILIECNYRDDILQKNVEEERIPGMLLKRTLESHMSYETCLSTLKANDLSGVNNIVLIHLSDGNSNAKEFKQGVEEATGKAVHVAERGMVINFNKTPF